MHWSGAGSSSSVSPSNRRVSRLVHTPLVAIEILCPSIVVCHHLYVFTNLMYRRVCQCNGYRPLINKIHSCRILSSFFFLHILLMSCWQHILPN